MIAPPLVTSGPAALARSPIRRAAAHFGRRAPGAGEWPWLPEASSVVVQVDDGTQVISLDVAATPGFLRVVDRNALVVEVPRRSALHRALGQHGRRPDITLWCRHPDAPGELARLQGVGSVGTARPDAGRSAGDQVCLRMTVFAVEWTADGPVPDSSTFPEAS